MDTPLTNVPPIKEKPTTEDVIADFQQALTMTCYYRATGESSLSGFVIQVSHTPMADQPLLISLRQEDTGLTVSCMGTLPELPDLIHLSQRGFDAGDYDPITLNEIQDGQAHFERALGYLGSESKFTIIYKFTNVEKYKGVTFMVTYDAGQYGCECSRDGQKGSSDWDNSFQSTVTYAFDDLLYQAGQATS